MSSSRGRPVLGGFTGIFFGLFLAVDLLFLSVIDLDSVLLYVLPVAFLLVGIGLGLLAPVGAARRGG